ncbi:MAG: hypothetical protein Tsb002_09360 [Wenzhouxiangellaceae bacterium]
MKVASYPLIISLLMALSSSVIANNPLPDELLAQHYQHLRASQCEINCAQQSLICSLSCPVGSLGDWDRCQKQCLAEEQQCLDNCE